MYDFKTAQTIECKLINKDYKTQNILFHQTMTYENTGIMLLDPAQLIELSDEGKINGDLKTFLVSINEEDNPILMKVTFY